MTKCKRPVCEWEALPYPRYGGYCSTECEKLHENELLEAERDELKVFVAKLEVAENAGLRERVAELEEAVSCAYNQTAEGTTAWEILGDVLKGEGE